MGKWPLLRVSLGTEGLLLPSLLGLASPPTFQLYLMASPQSRLPPSSSGVCHLVRRWPKHTSCLVAFSHWACKRPQKPGSEPRGLGTQEAALVPTGQAPRSRPAALLLGSVGTWVASGAAKRWVGKASLPSLQAPGEERFPWTLGGKSQTSTSK